MGVGRIFLSLFFLFFAALTCGGCFFVPECEDFECPSGESCILEDGVATCSGSSGENDNNTGNTAGQACSTDSDCATGLVCLPDLNGNDVCTQQ